MKLEIQFFGRCLLIATVASMIGFDPSCRAAVDPGVTQEKERELIRVLESNAPPADKAITCKHLAIYGSERAVPVLAPLLSNPELASWARIALEAIPHSAADEALRSAMAKLEGNLLIGVINSIGFRRDARAVPELVMRLKAPDTEVAAAVAEALGRIGGPEAARALVRALAGGPPSLGSAVAEGCILCAEKFLAEGKAAEAVRTYDAVRRAAVPKQRVLEATRGAILARQSEGTPLLLEELRAADKDRFHMALRTARELPGRQVTEALAAELKQANAERQPLLLLALADRQDAAVLPTLLDLAGNGPKPVRVAAVGVLERQGDAAAVPVLLMAAAENDADLAPAAKLALMRFEGNAVDAEVLSRLPQSQGTMRRVLLELAGQRRIHRALPTVLASVQDPDPAVRGAALETVGILGDAPQVADLVRVLQATEDSRERGNIEKALRAICGRAGASSVGAISPLMRESDSGRRIIGVHLLATMGGAEALAAVTAAVQDAAEAVQDEAVRALAAWPNNWPEDGGVAQPLLALARSGGKASHRIQGVRGYLQHVQVNKQYDNDQKLAQVKELWPVITRPEEKRLAIAVLGTVPSAGVLELLTTLTEDAAIAEEACLAIVGIAGSKDLPGSAREQRQKALQAVGKRSPNETTRQKAQELL